MPANSRPISLSLLQYLLGLSLSLDLFSASLISVQIETSVEAADTHGELLSHAGYRFMDAIQKSWVEKTRR